MNRFTTTLRTRSSSATSASLRHAASVVAAATLTACAGYNPGDLQPGSSEADLRARMGEPSGRHALPNGASALEFARIAHFLHDLVPKRELQVLGKGLFETTIVSGRQGQDLIGHQAVVNHHVGGLQNL